MEWRIYGPTGRLKERGIGDYVSLTDALWDAEEVLRDISSGEWWDIYEIRIYRLYPDGSRRQIYSKSYTGGEI